MLDRNLEQIINFINRGIKEKIIDLKIGKELIDFAKYESINKTENSQSRIDKILKETKGVD